MLLLVLQWEGNFFLEKKEASVALEADESTFCILGRVNAAASRLTSVECDQECDLLNHISHSIQMNDRLLELLP